MLNDLEEAQSALEPRGEQFPNCMKKITTMVRYWRNVNDKGSEIRGDAVQDTTETLSAVLDDLKSSLDGTGWKDRRVGDAFVALARAIGVLNSVEKL